MLRRNIREFLFVAAPKGLAGLCTLGINIVLLRFFGPEQYGSYALCVSIVLLSDAILGSALDLGVIRLATTCRDDDPRRCLAVQAAGFYVKLLFVFAGTSFVSLLASPLSQMLFHRRGQESLIYLSCGAVVALLALRSLQMLVQIEGRFFDFGLLEFIQMLLKYGGISALLVAGKGSAASVLSLLAAGPSAAILIFAAVWHHDIFPVPSVTWKLIRQLLDFVKWYLLTFSISALVNRADIFLLASWSSLREVGLFSAAQAFAYVPQLLGTYLSILLSPRIMPSWRAGQFFRFFRGFQSGMLVGCLILYVAAILAINTAGQHILPHSFVASQQIIVILLPGALAGLLTFPLTLSFLLFLKPRFLVAMDCVTLPFMVVLYYYAIKQHGAVGAAWVSSSSFVAKALIAQAMAWRLARSNQNSASAAVRLPQEIADVLAG